MENLEFKNDSIITAVQSLTTKENVPYQFARFKGAEWFDYLRNHDVIIGGAGGIGSWLSLLLARIGCNIYIFDPDLFEAHNMSGQLVQKSDLNKMKAGVAKSIAELFANNPNVEALGKYTKESIACPIMFSAFDNMEARKVMFQNWCNQVTDENRNQCVFIDGRLLAQDYQIFCVLPNTSMIQEYKTIHLFNSSEVEKVDCTYKQTSHSAAGIASHMVGFLTNFAHNRVKGTSIFPVPFFTEYHVESNYYNSMTYVPL